MSFELCFSRDTLYISNIHSRLDSRNCNCCRGAIVSREHLLEYVASIRILIFVDEARFSPAGSGTRGHCCHEEIGLRESTNRVQWNYVPSDADKGQSDFYGANSQVAASLLPPRGNSQFKGTTGSTCVRACKKVRRVAYKCGLKRLPQALMVPFRRMVFFALAFSGSRRRPPFAAFSWRRVAVVNRVCGGESRTNRKCSLDAMSSMTGEEGLWSGMHSNASREKPTATVMFFFVRLKFTSVISHVTE